METILSALTTSATAAANDAMQGIGNVIPVVLPVGAAVAVVFLVYKVIRRFISK